VRRDRRKEKRGGATVLAVTVARGEELRGLGLALEANNQIDCQLIQSFPVREYISPITKYLRKVIHLRKGNQLATITETVAEIGDGPGGATTLGRAGTWF
jgi:hypothetical protein